VVDIAVVVTGGVAETLQSTPLLRTLRAGFPTTRITLVCPSTAVELADGIPPVDQVIPLAELVGKRQGGLRLWLALRRQRLDAVFICSSGTLTTLAAYFAGIGERNGVGGGLRTLLLTGRVNAGRTENRALTWLRLAQVAGIHQELHAPVFEPGPEARRRAERVLHGTGLADGRLLVALAPGTGFSENGAATAATAWDPERWAHLANQLAQRHGAGILLVGSPNDRYAAERTKLDLRADATDLVGEIDLSTLAGVVARCDLLVGSDTPLLQLAAAMGTPTVGLFGPTDGARRGAYGPAHRVVQALAPPHFKEMRPSPAAMDQIRVDDVLAGIEATL
jgi:ADP-heptose:LPS heptosyltransferase